MAVASTETLLSLDRYAEIMGISPVHFNNLQDGIATQNYWNHFDHEALAAAIAQAEAMLAERLGFDIAPRYRSEVIAMPRTHRRDWWNMRIKLPHAYVQRLGSASWQLVEADAAVVLDSEYGTVTVNGDLVTADEYALFYRVADGAPSAHHGGWRIQTSDVTFTEGDPDTLILTAFRERFVTADALLGSQPADFNVNANFVTAVDVYALVTDAELPVTLHWDSLWDGVTPDSDETQTGAGRLVDKHTGRIQVRPATYNSETGTHSTAAPHYTDKPEHITIAYQAGYPLGDDGRINPQLEMAVVRLANTLMPDMGHRFNDVASTRWYGDREVDKDTGLPYGAAFAMTVANTPGGAMMATKGVIRKVRSPQRQVMLKRYSQTRRELLAILQEEADAVQKNFESVVSDWSTKNTPRFVQVKVSTEQRISILVRPDQRQKAAKIFSYVDKGTDPHVITPKKPGGVLVFQAGYLPRTAPIVGGGGRSIGDTVFTRKVNHPGTEPRDFSDKIHAKSARRFRRDIENAFRRLARKV